MELLSSLRFVLGASMLIYGAWTDHKTRRVPNQTWLISGTLGSAILAYEFTTEEYDLHIWALLFATVVLFYNAFVDEYVLDNNQMMLWRATQVLGILCAVYFLASYDSEEMSAQDYKLLDVVSISILILLMYAWFYFGPTIGGADVKAIMTIGLVAPFTLSFDGDTFTAFETRGFPYPFVVFMNSLLLYLFIPLSLAVYNLYKGNLENPYFQMFFGTKMEIGKARKSFVWPMQKVVGGKVVMIAFVKHKDDSDAQWNKLEESGIDNPWITFKIPYIIPLALSFFLSALFGDLFSQYLVSPLNSLFS